MSDERIVKPQNRNRMLAEQEITDCDIMVSRGRRGDGGKSRKTRSVKVNLSESPLGWLHARGHLTDRQFTAGERLRSEWEAANLAPNITMNWNPVRQGRGGVMQSPTERQIAAKQRFQAAEQHLGADLRDIAWRVICAGDSVPIAEKTLGWPVRSGKLVLRIALDRIADFYGIQ